ncbi:MAG: hypothetical protein ABGZ23_20900 [Fuerstiella sp.]
MHQQREQAGPFPPMARFRLRLRRIGYVSSNPHINTTHLAFPYANQAATGLL